MSELPTSSGTPQTVYTLLRVVSWVSLTLIIVAIAFAFSQALSYWGDIGVNKF